MHSVEYVTMPSQACFLAALHRLAVAQPQRTLQPATNLRLFNTLCAHAYPRTAAARTERVFVDEPALEQTDISAREPPALSPKALLLGKVPGSGVWSPYLSILTLHTYYN